jgi:dTDP-4-amino-4,6-dideoxygalactose transaminase
MIRKYSFRIGEEEKQEVLEVLESGYLFRYGDLSNKHFKHKVYSFEKEFAAYSGVDYALATNSGTGSLYISLLAMGINPDDEIIVPAYTFVASYSACIFSRGIPVLAEVDESLTIDPNAIEAKITPKTKAIMPVHMLGNPCDMDAIMGIARKHGLMVLEDCCQACGGTYKGKKLGSLGDMGAFSLNIYKTITAGDGGIIITKNDAFYENAFSIHDQGHSPHRTGVETGKRNILGLNFRATELTGAVALAQLRKIDRIIETLKEKKKNLKEMLSNIEGTRFRVLNDSEGECGTFCTVIFDTHKKAAQVAYKLGTTTIDHSGWHVYSNMEHVNTYLKETGQPYGKGAYPKTDDILSRSINISIGVVEAGLESGFGIHIYSTDDEIRRCAEKFKKACT